MFLPCTKKVSTLDLPFWERVIQTHLELTELNQYSGNGGRVQLQIVSGKLQSP